jgi:type II secretory pathway pseudopilin PulG
MARPTTPGSHVREPLPRLHGGFTYLLLMFAIALMGVAMAAVGTVWHTEQKRAKEKELLFIGHAYRTAIGQYYEKTPGSVKKYPQSMKDLLKDNRYLTTQRYLRQLYRDPMTNGTEWGLVEGPDHIITGVYSLSKDTPVKIANFDDTDKAFAGSQHYDNWKFIYVPKSTPATPAPSPNSAIRGPNPATPSPNAPTAAPQQPNP